MATPFPTTVTVTVLHDPVIDALGFEPTDHYLESALRPVMRLARATNGSQWAADRAGKCHLPPFSGTFRPPTLPYGFYTPRRARRSTGLTRPGASGLG